MSERKAVTLAIVAVTFLSGVAFTAVALLGGDEWLPMLAALVVLCVGVDQISKLILKYHGY